MPVPEEQLETWSQIGAIQSSARTNEIITNVLTDRGAPYANRSFQPPFLQGSYKNNTNIRTDSDVDLVICTDEIFYHNLYEVNPPRVTADGIANFQRSHPGEATYSQAQFKADVTQWLTANFGNDVRPGGKAIYIRGNDNRRDADVLVTAQFRHYFNYVDEARHDRADGIVFWKADGTRIVNFPRQHADNCTTKNQNTRQWFKQTVRVFKNMRNKMIEDGLLAAGVAPSYYLEGLLSNAPDNCFGHSFQRTYEQCMGYLRYAPVDDLKCLNGVHYLVRANSDVNWSPDNFAIYTQATSRFWDGFGRRVIMGLGL
ncbi:nucleotidyltransferase [Mesorhizobium sp.]|uniref:nucleotidyltransferase domain-containing protein n=1 Tax=Mesorhizobium sp. TaxID=1871066 RepID=UPI000FE46640|nr:nucleotidyltransferase [Mesorhizobium sp.]RWO49218.1 MAG: nucleotidyltransferase [Mesorhizobium sp.]